MVDAGLAEMLDLFSGDVWGQISLKMRASTKQSPRSTKPE
jgi:hypothetical protein